MAEALVRRRRARSRSRAIAELARVAAEVRGRGSVVAGVVRRWTERRRATSARRWEMTSRAMTADIG